jgi:hypothetical protein
LQAGPSKRTEEKEDTEEDEEEDEDDDEMYMDLSEMLADGRASTNGNAKTAETKT